MCCIFSMDHCSIFQAKNKNIHKLETCVKLIFRTSDACPTHIYACDVFIYLTKNTSQSQDCFVKLGLDIITGQEQDGGQGVS